jgi:hypothetical protein
MENLVGLGLIKKSGGRLGIAWNLTEKGLFILKRKITWSVFPSDIPRGTPVRLENVSIAFKIYGQIPENRFQWTEMRNGVSKCSIYKSGYTIELIRSEKQQQEGGTNIMLIHLSKQYCLNWTETLIKQAYLALHYARQASIQFGLNISEQGYLVKRPHIAFEYDLIAIFIAASNTAEMKTGEEEAVDARVWIDSSTGIGELETNDPSYVYNYLKMPGNIVSIREDITSLHETLSGLSGYTTCWHPTLTHNN